MKHYDGDARDEERERGAEPPEPAHEGRAPEALALADDCRDGREVVCLDRVLQTRHEAEGEHGGGREWFGRCHSKNY